MCATKASFAPATAFSSCGHFGSIFAKFAKIASIVLRRRSIVHLSSQSLTNLTLASRIFPPVGISLNSLSLALPFVNSIILRRLSIVRAKLNVLLFTLASRIFPPVGISLNSLSLALPFVNSIILRRLSIVRAKLNVLLFTLAYAFSSCGNQRFPRHKRTVPAFCLKQNAWEPRLPHKEKPLASIKGRKLTQK